MNYLTQLIENQGNEGLPCEKVLGSDTRVKQMGTVWGKYAKLFHLVGAHGIINYVREHDFTDSEVKAFEAGLAVIPNFMQECFVEMQEKSTQEANK